MLYTTIGCLNPSCDFNSESLLSTFACNLLNELNCVQQNPKTFEFFPRALQCQQLSHCILRKCSTDVCSLKLVKNKKNMFVDLNICFILRVLRGYMGISYKSGYFRAEVLE